MRLLKLLENGDFSLVEFVGNKIPPYAILSHTWGADDEEVTFRDLSESTGKTKAGYAKIRFCSKQAANDGLKYSWVDTCCIDKSSSAELSEAINCMFRWYNSAARCYVHLADVSIRDAIQEPWESAFRRSRWFTRGWTLQELIAPKSLEFFSSEGKRLGDRTSLEHDIHDITRVDVRALRGAPVSDFGIDERMSWAIARQTKRDEDAAYSLLGIFDIHMPLLYGEGRQKALARLHKKVQKSVKNTAPDVPSAPPSTQDDAFKIEEAPEKSASLQDIFAKRWPQHFLKRNDRILYDEGSYVESIRQFWGAKGDTFDILLSRFEGDMPSYIFEELSNFCRTDQLIDFNSEDVRNAWLDDRSFSDLGRHRKYRELMSADELHRCLSMKRFGLDGIPDADRRLIYIKNLDPNYILTLAATASFHQVKALIVAIWQHVAFRTSICIHLSVEGFPTFRLECQLPYVVFSPSPDGYHCVPNSKLRRHWTDVSFLEPQSTYPGSVQSCGFAEAQFSLVICGSDDSQWVAYSFDDAYTTETENWEQESLNSDSGVNEDRIYSEIDADLPIWNPREYFLVILNSRSAQVLLEWENLSARIEHSIKLFEEQKNASPFYMGSLRADRDRIERIEKNLDWILNIIELLSRLRNLLCKTVRAWTLFKESSGDVGYLSDLLHKRPWVRDLTAIDGTFKRLKVIEQDFFGWEQHFKTLAGTLELRLARERSSKNWNWKWWSPEKVSRDESEDPSTLMTSLALV